MKKIQLLMAVMLLGTAQVIVSMGSEDVVLKLDKIINNSNRPVVVLKHVFEEDEVEKVVDLDVGQSISLEEHQNVNWIELKNWPMPGGSAAIDFMGAMNADTNTIEKVSASIELEDRQTKSVSIDNPRKGMYVVSIILGTTLDQSSISIIRQPSPEELKILPGLRQFIGQE